MKSERMLDWMDRLAHSLVHHAARRAPGPLSERLEEEWLADMLERSGAFSRLRLAVGCCWATYVIAREHGVAKVPATSSPVYHANFAGYKQDDSSLFSRRTVTFLVVASLHAAVFGGLAVGLSSHFTKETPPQFVVREIPQTATPIDFPSLPEPKMSPTTIEVPPVKDALKFEPDPTVEVVAKDTLPVPHVPQRAELPPLPAPVVNRVQGGPGIGFPTADDFYPSPSIRLGEQGVATVRACVDGKGRLTSGPTILQSTGSSRLDEAALRLAKAGSGHYLASTEDGQPINSCYPFRIRFNLRS
jgi:TonB family protein